MPSGTTQLDFGAFPGGSDASVVVAGQTTILAGSLVEAWIFPADTADHLTDEHLAEPIKVTAARVVAGVGFTIYGVSLPQPPVVDLPFQNVNSQQDPTNGRNAPTIYGKWNVAWAWL